MKHVIEKIGTCRVKATVTVDPALWKAAQEKAFDKIAKTVVVKGFRPGAAPKEMIKPHVNPEQVFNDAIEDILTPVFADLLTEEKIRPFARPDVNVTKLTPDELELVYTITLIPTVKLGEYKGLAAKKEAPAVTDDEVKAAIDKLLAGNASLAVVDRPCKLGDTVVLDFDGYLPDEKGALKAFEGGKADNYSLELGSHSFVPGFEEAVVGMKSGEKKDIEVTFPTNYVKELAGKKATFKINLHEIKEKQVPALNDASVKDLAIKDVDTVAKLQDYEKKGLLADKVSKAEEAYYNSIIDAIVKNASYEIAEEVVASEAASMEDNLKKQIEQQGLTFEQYLEITGSKEDDLKKKFAEDAEKNIKGFLALEEVANAEKISVDDKDIDAEVAKLAEQYKLKPEEVRGYMNKDIEHWKDNIRQRKIKDYILSVSK
jgi:trigger factor